MQSRMSHMAGDTERRFWTGLSKLRRSAVCPNGASKDFASDGVGARCASGVAARTLLGRLATALSWLVLALGLGLSGDRSPR